LANQKEIRTRITSVKNTQKITRAMKMVAGARLNRAQTRIMEMRPLAQKTVQVLLSAIDNGGEAIADEEETVVHPLLAAREAQRVAILVLTSDRGLCGAFNSALLRQVMRRWKELQADGKEVTFYVAGRKGRDFLSRRGAPVAEYFPGVWDSLDLEQARRIAQTLVRPFAAGKVDAIYLMYNEFKSAMTQIAVESPLFPLSRAKLERDEASQAGEPGHQLQATQGYLFEPDRASILDVLVPMYIEITILRALYESVASELGARMTAMDSATKNAKDMISALTLQYNRARQAAITTELMEIIGGAEALNG
jgi:F-type H+-transporting ATPase subunit gamma